MPAIPSHSTATVDRPWDAGLHVGRISNDAGRATLRRMYAWVDPDADADTKNAYSLPHHEVSTDGRPGAANLPGVRNALSRLPQSGIPDGDQDRVRTHLRGHLEDGGGGEESASADTRSDMTLPREDLIRGITPVRAQDEGNTMVGYPIVFNQWTEIDSWEGHFLERIAPGAAERSIKNSRGEDGSFRVRVQYNHGMHPVVGTSGLGKPRTIKADQTGYYTETPLSNTSYNRDIIKPQLRDGTLDGMSFRFSVVREDVVNNPEPSDHNPRGLPERTVQEIKLFEFGPVDWPAYEATQAGIRSAVALAAWQRMPEGERRELMRQFGMAADITAPSPEPSVSDRDVYADAHPDCETTGCDAPTAEVVRHGSALQALCRRHHAAKLSLARRRR